jgi:hypothetical protein
LIDKVDCFDEPRLLILRNLLKTQSGSKIPAYRLARFIFLFVFLRDRIQLIQISRIAGKKGAAQRVALAATVRAMWIALTA